MWAGERFRFAIEWRERGCKIRCCRQSGTRPCKKRKDGAPTVVVVSAKIKGRATRPLAARSVEEMKAERERQKKERLAEKR